MLLGKDRKTYALPKKRKRTKYCRKRILPDHSFYGKNRGLMNRKEENVKNDKQLHNKSVGEKIHTFMGGNSIPM